jgi:MoxR-like ATPase
MEITNIQKITANSKEGFVDVTIDGNVFTRKSYKDQKSTNQFVIIEGYKITFTKDLWIIDCEKAYETKGVKRASTTSMAKARMKSNVMAVEKKPVIEEAKEIKLEVKTGEIKHSKYNQIKTCIECNIPVYLAGPAGSGKNHTVEQIAKELNYNFYFSNSIQQEFKLTGFIDAGGNYHNTEFYKACTDDNDCIFFLDEMDASIPEVLVLLNAAIANGYFEFPNGRVDLKHVHFIAAGNTVGSGADEMYTGRMVIDQATLDRFAIIEFDYDENIENAITKGNVELVNFIHGLRHQAEEKGIRATFSYRCLIQMTKLEAKGMDLEIALKITVFKGLDKDTLNTFQTKYNTKYDLAFNKIKEAA